jgi:carbonic anhydrase/acetyltransferase-like protein (isoleucine patch superfamily)
MGALVLNGAHIGAESIVAAGTLIPEGMVVPPGSLVMGVPGKLRRPITDEERAGLRQYAQNYVEYKETYLAESGVHADARN